MSTNYVNLKGKKALIVDDEDLIREIFIMELSELGIETDEAKSGNSAFEMVMKKDYDFIITDVRMPDGSGKDLLLKLQEEKKDVFTVMITGFSDIGDEEAKGLGANAIFEKPFNLDQILKFLEDNI